MGTPAAAKRSRLAAAGNAEAPVRGPVATAIDLPPDRSIPFLIRELHRLTQRDLEARLVSYTIAVGWWFFLRALWEEDGLSQRKLSRRVGILDATTATVIDRLEQAGFVRRVRDSDDRRKVNVHLTAAGRKLKTRSDHVSKLVDGNVLLGFSQSEQRRLRNYLHRIRRNLNAGIMPCP
jgi:DNA-binding MarR family transcriptional regulator